MLDSEIPLSLRQASTKWKFVTYCIAVVGFGWLILAVARFLVATVILFFQATEDSAGTAVIDPTAPLLLFGPPILYIVTPFLVFALPYLWVRMATPQRLRIIASASIIIFLSLLALALLIPGVRPILGVS